MRATFQIKLAGEKAQVENAIDAIGDDLNKQGLMYDEDFEALLGQGGDPIGLILRTLRAVQAVTAYIQQPRFGIYMVEVE